MSAQSALVGLAGRLPAWTVPSAAWPTLLAQTSSLAPSDGPAERSTLRLVADALYSRARSAESLAELRGRAVPRDLRPFAVAAAMAARDEDAVRIAVAGEREKGWLATSSVAAMNGAFEDAIRCTGSVPRAYTERWIVAAHAAGDDSAALAMGEALGGSRVRDVTRALAASRDAVAILGGGLDGLAYSLQNAEPYERRAGSVIYVAAQSLPYRNGGYASRTHGLVSALKSAGRDVLVLTRLGFPRDTWPRAKRNNPVAPEDVVGGVRYVRAGDGPGRVPLSPHALAFARIVEAQAREHGAEVIHSASFPSTALGAAVAANALGVPFVYEVRALEALYAVSENPAFDGTEGQAALMAAELAVCNRADRILVITRAIGDQLAAAGVPGERIAVVGNAVDPAAFAVTPPDPELRVRLGLDGRTVIGYAGAMLNYEGLDILADALDELATRRDDFALLALGDGPERDGLLARAASASYPFVLPGRLPHEEVARHLALADICPFPRRSLPITEAVSPMKPFEAMALGKAVVVSDVAALAEIVADGVTGLVCRAGDAETLAERLDRLLDDADLRARLGIAAREWVTANATWAARAAAVEAVYDSLSPASS